MLGEEKIMTIYLRALEDEQTFNDLLDNPENLRSEFDLSDSDIDDLISIFNQAFTRRNLLKYFKDLIDKKPKPRPGPLPEPWDVTFEAKFK